MEASATERRPTGLKEARDLVRDLFEPRAAVYWPDFLASAAVGWAGLLALVWPPWPWIPWLAAPLSVLGLYRALLFIHELTHLAPGSLPGFAAAWNGLIGIPMMVPSFTYVGVHTDHHRRQIYGTAEDPEYLPLARQSRAAVVWFLVETVFAPALLFLRFVVVAPLTWAVPPLRRWIETHASSLVTNMAYRRREPVPAARRRMIAVEVLIFACWAAVLSAVVLGRLPARFLAVFLAVSAAVAVVNQIRTLAAHRWRNAGGEMDVVGQLTDTVNVPGSFGTALWAPVGLRFHALHHWLPDLPYHALLEAHRRLLASLPPDAPYRTVNAGGLLEVVRTVWNEAAGARSGSSVRIDATAGGDPS